MAMIEKNPEAEVRVRVNNSGENGTVHPLEVANNRNPVVYVEDKRSKKWVSWLVPCFVIANIVMFIITMYVNNCPKNTVSCVARFLGRFSFQPFKENPLLGPSSVT